MHYRDVKRQNDWLRENMFDAMGNYLFCCACVRIAFGISKQRITRQRAIKRKQFKEPLQSMSKAEVEKERLGEYVVMPKDLDVSFKNWWRFLDPLATVDVRTPHSRHGNSGKVSNSAKTCVMNDFLEFVDVNSQPNGRSADSTGPTFYFLPNFSTIQIPKAGIANYEERARRSVVGEFNRSQREAGKGECSNASSHNWLKKHRPKHAICPHQEDYCDTCAEMKTKISSQQTTINRKKQSSDTLPDDLKHLEDELSGMKHSLEIHRKEAKGAHDYYQEVTVQCADEWKKILEFVENPCLSETEARELATLKHKFNIVLSADYQMGKLVPYWGESPQPGSTYYYQKLNHDVFGIVNHATNKSAVYLFDERIGPKNTDHTVSYLTHYLAGLPDFVRRLHLFLDNASSTNKNCFTMAWAMEMIQQAKLDFIRVSFMIPGHTKFAPDLLFSKISKTYNKSDVFTTEELKNIIFPYAEVIVDDGSVVSDWRNKLSKYSKFPGIRSLHDFLFVKNSATGKVVSKVRKLCYTGSYTNSTIHLQSNRSIDQNVLCTEDDTYKEKTVPNKYQQPNLLILNTCTLLLFQTNVGFHFYNCY